MEQSRFGIASSNAWLKGGRVKFVLSKARTKAGMVVVALAVGFVALVATGALHGATDGVATIMTGLIFAQPFIGLVTLCQATRHRLIVQDTRLSFPTALESVVLAAGLNLVAPVRLSELLKATYLREQVQIPTNVALSAIAVERLTDVAVVLTFLPFIPAVIFTGWDWKFPVAALAVALLLGIFHARIKGMLSRLLGGHMRDFSVSLVESFGERMTSLSFVLGALLGATSLLSSIAAIHVYLSVASPTEIGLRGSLAVFLAGVAGGAAAMLPGGIGSYHAAVTLALVGMGLDVGTAFALSVGMHLVQYLLVFPAAIAIVFARNLGISAMFKVARALILQGEAAGGGPGARSRTRE